MKTYKYMDMLDDHGMLLCYTLLRKVPTLKADRHRLVDVKFLEILHSNKYIELLSLSGNMNKRKRIEKEQKVRAIWNFWIDPIIERPGAFSYVFEEAKLYKFPFPMSNESYSYGEYMTSPTWEEFDSGELNDFTALIKATMVLNGAEKGILKDTSVEKYLEPFYVLKEDKVLVNSHMSLALCVYSHAQLLQHSTDLESSKPSESQLKQLCALSTPIQSICNVLEASRGHIEGEDWPVAYGVSSMDNTVHWTTCPLFLTQGEESWKKVSERIDPSVTYAASILQKVITITSKATSDELPPELQSAHLQNLQKTLQQFLTFRQSPPSNTVPQKSQSPE